MERGRAEVPAQHRLAVSAETPSAPSFLLDGNDAERAGGGGSGLLDQIAEETTKATRPGKQLANLRGLPEALAEGEPDGEKLKAVVAAAAASKDVDVRLAVAEGLGCSPVEDAVQEEVAKVVLPEVRKLVEDPVEEVSEAGSQVQARMATKLDERFRREEIEEFIMEMARAISETKRVAAAKLTEAVSPSLSATEAERILPVTASIASDDSFKVRRAATEAIPPIAIPSGPEKAAEVLLPAMATLAADTNWTVRKGVAEKLGDFASSLVQSQKPSSAASATIGGALASLLNDASGWVRQAAVRAVTGVADGAGSRPLTSSVVSALTWAVMGTPSLAILQACATALPAVLAAFSRDGGVVGKDKANLGEGIAELANSPEAEVRAALLRALAARAHDLAYPGAKEVVAPQAAMLLADDSPEVTLAALAESARALELVDPAERGKAAEAVLASIERFKGAPEWRHRLAAANALTALASHLPQSTCYQRLFPAATSLLADPVASVRSAAAAQLGVLLYRASNGDELCDGLQRSLNLLRQSATSSSYLVRQSFLDACESVAKAFGPSFVLNEFSSQLPKLADDRVRNVRSRVATLLGTLKGSDDQGESLVSDFGNRLSRDPDPETSRAAHKAFYVSISRGGMPTSW